MLESLKRRIVDLAKDERRTQPMVMRFMMIAGAAGFMVLGAQLKVFLPGSVVPYTFQLLFALMAGALLGPADVLIAMGVYIGVGAAGIPVFASANGLAGLAYLGGPTGGYVFGLAGAAVFVGFVERRTTGFASLLAAMLGGVVIVHAFGVAHLAAVTGYSALAAIKAGSVPFIAFDVLKAGFAYEGYRRFAIYAQGPQEKKSSEEKEREYDL